MKRALKLLRLVIICILLASCDSYVQSHEWPPIFEERPPFDATANKRTIKENKAALSKAPNDAEVHYKLAKAYFELSLSQKVLQYTTYSTIKQTFYDAKTNRLRASKQKNLYLAKKELEKAIRINPSFAEAYLLYGRCIENQGIEVQNWRADAQNYYLKALKLKPNDPEILYRLGRVSDQAEKYLKEAIRLKPDYQEAYERLITHCNLQNEFEKSIEISKEFVRQFPDKPFSHFYLGRVYKKIKDYPNAIKEFKKVLEIEPIKGSKAQVEIGRIYQDLKDYPKAIEALKKAISIYPDSSNEMFAIISLRDTYEKQGSKFDEFAEYIKEQLKRQPKFKSTYYKYLGDIYFSKKDYKSARDAFEKAISPKYQTASIYEKLSKACIETKDYTSAKKYALLSKKYGLDDFYFEILMRRIDNVKANNKAETERYK